jgi:hypothetical protein
MVNFKEILRWRELIRLDVTSTNWDCAVNRTDGSAGSQMMLINHFLDNVRS